MIAGIGTDLVEIYRIEEMILRGRHLSRIFTTTELAYAKDNATTLAGNFAVKRSRFQSIWNRLFRCGTIRD